MPQEQRFPGQKMNADSVADMQWIYETAKARSICHSQRSTLLRRQIEDRAETFGIQAEGHTCPLALRWCAVLWSRESPTN